MALTDFRPDAMRCTRCSYCKWIPFDLVKSARFSAGCPSIEAGGFHAYSAGGRLVTALSLMDGRSEVTDQVVDIAFKCQLCGNCDVACKMCRYDMEPLAALRELRAHLVEQDRVPDSYRPLIERTRAALAGKGPKTPADRNQWAEGLGLVDPAKEACDVVFYAGCKYSGEESLRDDRAHAGAAAPARRPHRRPVRERLLRRPRRQDGLPRRGRAGRQPDAGPVAGGRREDVVTPCADCRHVFTRVYPTYEGAWEGMPQVLHTVECVERLVRDGRLELDHARREDRDLPRPLQPRPPGRALRAVGRGGEEDLRPGRRLRPAAAALQRRQGRLPAAARPAGRHPRPRARRDGALARGRLVLRRRRRLPRGVPRVLGGHGGRAPRGGRLDRRRRPRHRLLALRAELQRGRRGGA